ncbi:hypothetical protein [Vibrio phage vB_VmeM-Yong XC32]|nr:hypothetical protein [Vibrio phage vB_VmeM-Yong XC31]QAX96345.1 hypothetical protein [Vibrio phage vB_VmeM-Yong XC32]QAX96663.1 hypothetical protein [Vibrio phage vB_VmeM-Yong MS31]QAX96981.1 hypothetical protein [Vibrio phage vB_VmeM-Yong MS32]
MEKDEFDLSYQPEALPEQEQETKEPEAQPVNFEYDELDMPEGYQFVSPFMEANESDMAEIALPGSETDVNHLAHLIHEIRSDETLSIEDRRATEEYLRQLLGQGTLSERYGALHEGKTTLAQYLAIDGRRVANSRIGFKTEDGTRLRGAAARSRMQAKLGTGTPVVWRMWHSGFSVEMGNFAPGEIFKHQVDLLTAVENIAIKTNGQILSADDAYYVTKMTDFCIEHIYNCTIKNWSHDVIRQRLDVRDIYTLLCAGLAAMYPNGYPFVRDCRFKIDKEKACDWSTLKGLEDVRKITRLDFRLLTWEDSDKFTPAQVRLVNMPWDSVTVKDLDDYRDNLPEQVVTTGVLNEKTGGDSIWRAVIRAPFYSDYRRETLEWVSDVELQVDRALANAPDTSPEAANVLRRQSIESYIKRITAQRHSSWIREIVEMEGTSEILYGGENVGKEGLINRKEVVERLADMSENGEVCANLIKAVEDYKAENTFSFVAIPNFQCPTCKKGQSEPKATRPHLIPIPVTHYFFAITVSNSGQRN